MPTVATIRGPCSTTWGTRTSNTPSGTPTWRPTDSRTFGGTDDGGAGSTAPHGRSSRSKKTTRHIVEITRPLAVASCAECAPSGRPPCGLQHQSVGLVLGLGQWRTLQRSLRGWPVGSRKRGRLRRAFNDFRRLTGSRREHGLDELDGLLDLLVAHSLDAPRMFNFHIPRAQPCQQLAVSRRLVLAHLGNCRWTAVPEVSEQGRNKLAVQLLTVTRADRTVGIGPAILTVSVTLTSIDVRSSKRRRQPHLRQAARIESLFAWHLMSRGRDSCGGSGGARQRIRRRPSLKTTETAVF